MTAQELESEIYSNKYNKLILQYCDIADLDKETKEGVWLVVEKNISFINELLNDITKEERVNLCKSSIRLFANYYLNTYLFPHQIRWLSYIEDYDKLQLIAARGGSKSNTLLSAKPAHEIYKNRNINIAVICNTHAKAEERVTKLRNMLVMNERLINDCGIFFDRKQYTTSRTSEFTIIRDDINDFRTIKGHGWNDESKTGGHYDLIICDDICEIQDAQSLSQMDKMENEFFQNIMNMIKNDKSKVALIGTEKGMDDIYKRVEKRETFITIREPAIIKGYEYLTKPSYELIRKTDEKTGRNIIVDVKIKDEYRKKFKVLWSVKWTIRDLILNYIDDPAGFNREMMGISSGGIGNIFKLETFETYDDLPLGIMDSIVAGVDLSDGVGGDDSTIVFVARDVAGYLYLYDAFGSNELDSDQFYNHIERLCMKHKLKLINVIMETNRGRTETLGNYNMYTTNDKTYIPFSGVSHNKNKNKRIESTLLHLFTAHTLRIPAEKLRRENPYLNAVCNQLTYFNINTDNRDDYIDSLEMACAGFTKTIETEYVYKQRRPEDFARKKREQLKKFKL